ncbi:hypothetical protein [Amycolatopsis magusensis]|uniref:Tetratricopeptide repeat protein n=1 Tax=Amycolatopsis magusensis TaxID=882444 RepID=A0ABS4Q175_9PSEU|nr:hypothetical protein [Amycolatopsis magusensis]MBP2185421.1 hypothetical protein [Amycolatopsis magusensis]
MSGTTDTLMAAIGQAVTRGREGDPDGARDELLTIWESIAGSSDSFHQCVLAHYLADLYGPAEAIVWDERALEAADRAGEAAPQVAGFYPSLHLNLADNYRRLGSFDTATVHVSKASELVSSLPGGPYADQLVQWIEQVAELITRRSTEPLTPTGDGVKE